MRRILISGSSGLIGSILIPHLRSLGAEVFSLVRRKGSLAPDELYWDPEEGQFSKEGFEGFDAVIHLAGANIAARRWTRDRKAILRTSRCRDTWLLSQVLSFLHQPPKVVIAASAVGFYGNRGQEELSENSEQGKGFLSELCAEWEKGLEGIKNRGARVVHARFGSVITAKGGVLKQLLPAFRLKMGALLGSGEQLMSWIGIEDLLGAIVHLLSHQEVEGAVNITSPHPISQRMFATMLGALLDTPCVLKIPPSLLSLLFGEIANEVLLSSTNAYPAKLLASGYQFLSPDFITVLTREVSQ